MSTNALDPKDPSARIDYQFSWVRYLKPGETIVSYTLDSYDGLVIDQETNDGQRITFFCAGGMDGEVYFPRCNIVTSLGRVDVRTMMIKVQQT